MAIGEEARHALYTRLQAVLGNDEAATLMSHLPPVGWADVATKQDLATLERVLRAELRAEIGELRGEIGGLRGEIGGLRGEMERALRQQTRTFVIWTSTLMVSLVAFVSAAAG